MNCPESIPAPNSKPPMSELGRQLFNTALGNARAEFAHVTNADGDHLKHHADIRCEGEFKPKVEAPITDADLMRLAIYSDSPAERSKAVLAWGNRQFAAGMAAAADRVLA